MTDQELAEIRARLDAASERPFAAERTPTRGMWAIVAGGEWKPGEYLVARDEDAEFLTHARQDIERLLAEVERPRRSARASEPKPAGTAARASRSKRAR